MPKRGVLNVLIVFAVIANVRKTAH